MLLIDCLGVVSWRVMGPLLLPAVAVCKAVF